MNLHFPFLRKCYKMHAPSWRALTSNVPGGQSYRKYRTRKQVCWRFVLLFLNLFSSRPAKTGPFIILLCHSQTILLVKGEPSGGKGLTGPIILSAYLSSLTLWDETSDETSLLWVLLMNTLLNLCCFLGITKIKRDIVFAASLYLWRSCSFPTYQCWTSWKSRSNWWKT